MRTPADKRIVFTYYSHPMKDLRLRWKAQLAFEPGSTDESEAVLTIADGVGEPIAEGVFELAGKRIAVQNGEGRLRCGDFAKGKHEQAIWLYRAELLPIPGALTFE